ncbi:hypothetical protein DENSPDRAFT_838770 [Dentipellis sp. KUC8613]|nr:hypothetical protein DENSPDRAFT_838770 [Dentipellis sp. KUC8613]
MKPCITVVQDHTNLCIVIVKILSSNVSEIPGETSVAFPQRWEWLVQALGFVHYSVVWEEFLDRTWLLLRYPTRCQQNWQSLVDEKTERRRRLDQHHRIQLIFRTYPGLTYFVCLPPPSTQLAFTVHKRLPYH